MEIENDDMNLVDNMIHLLSDIKQSISEQIAELNKEDFEPKTDDELIELAVKEYEENLSFIDEIVEEKFKSASN